MSKLQQVPADSVYSYSVGISSISKSIRQLSVRWIAGSMTLAVTLTAKPLSGDSLVPRPLFPQLRMDYITATWKEGLAHRSNFLVLTCLECYANYCVVISVVIV